MKETRERTRLAAYLVVSVVGFFALVGQTLLFREFLTVYEGNELGVASFFSSWLLWVALGALLARSGGRFFDWLTEHFAVLPLLYVPVYVLQVWLIQNSRPLAGIESYELFPFVRMLPVALLANVPLSLLSGALFTLACRWYSLGEVIPVARVYIAEALGSAAGGVAVTALLAIGLSAESVFLYSVFLLALSTGLYQLSRRAYILAGAPVLVVALAFVGGVDQSWQRSRELRAWEQLLPPEAYLGSFTTPQARYLYGEYHEQFEIVAWESVVESIPGTEHASEVLAVNLAQHPEARAFLVIGPGSFSLCHRLLELPQADSVTWLDPDPSYPQNLLEVLPERWKAGTERLRLPAVDIRDYLQRNPGRHDLVILNLPDITTLALNRYSTGEFFTLLSRSLKPDGVVGVRVSGGENFMGDELVNVGASVYRTLRSLFEKIVVKPGDESWLIASHAGRLSTSPAVLRDRFQAMKGAASLYPPDGLMSLYVPDRIEFQLESYRSAVAVDTHNLLLNTDRDPKALLHSLLLTVRQAGASLSLSAFVRFFAVHGFPVLLSAVLVYVLLRALYLSRMSARGLARSTGERVQSFDWYFLVFSTGAVGMSLSILLMFVYQSVHGSLFLHVGLISALFMLGLFGGSIACERILIRKAVPVGFLLPLSVLVHLLLLVLVGCIPQELSRQAFALLFLGTGLVNGVYVPIAAAKLKSAGYSDKVAGGLIALYDNLGGALGGLLTGLVFLPLFGTVLTLVVLALSLAVSLPPLLLHGGTAGGGRTRDRFEDVVRPAGYTMFGISAFLLISTLLLEHAKAGDSEQLLRLEVQTMAPDAEPVRESHTLANGEELIYFVERDAENRVEAYFFATDLLAPEVVGYGGPLSLAMKVDGEGILRDVRVLESNETPAYLESLETWQRGLGGHNVCQNPSLAGVDAVSGATFTSSAILQALRQAGQRFAAEVLGWQVEKTVPARRAWWPEKRAACLILLLGAAFFLRRRPSRGVRRILLVTTFVISGLWLNMQYSLVQVFSLLSLRIPALGLNVAFLLVVVLPVVTVLFGNLYCGYLCPFGAVQELIGDLRPRKLKTNPDTGVWRFGRLLKYVLLFLLVALFAISLDPGLSSSDPLVTVFGGERSVAVAVLVAATLILSFFFNRFWCRNLCPAGAFLSLLGGVRMLKRFIPLVNFKLCMYGVTGAADLDCICCDRCRAKPLEAARRLSEAHRAPVSWRRRAVFVTAACLVALVFAGAAISRWHLPGLTSATPGVTGAGGEARNVDMQKLKSLIRQRRLSDREALHYKPAEEPAARPPAPEER